MTDFEGLVISGADYQEFSKALSSTCRALPREVAKRLCAIKDQCTAKYGFDGIYSRLNNRSVSQIFAEYQSEDIKPIVSGEIEGMRYRLYDAPSPEAPDRDNASDE
jgi:hypothetical protein